MLQWIRYHIQLKSLTYAIKTVKCLPYITHNLVTSSNNLITFIAFPYFNIPDSQQMVSLFTFFYC